MEGNINFVNSKGELLYKQWYDKIEEPVEGIRRVKIDHMYNFIDENENLLSEEWFNNALDFYEGYAIVEKSGTKFNCLDKKGKFLFKEWVHGKCKGMFHDGYLCYDEDGTGHDYNFVDKTGKKLLSKSYDFAKDFDNGYAIVERYNNVTGRQERNLIDTNGNLLFSNWYNSVTPFREGYAVVRNSTAEYNLIDKDENLLFTRWYDGICSFSCGRAIIAMYKKDSNGMWRFFANYVKRENGKMLFTKQIFDCTEFSNGTAWIKRTKTASWECIDTNGNPAKDDGTKEHRRSPLTGDFVK